MVVMKKYCNKFTLVEILAVVALIGILTAIGFGAYTYAMNSAKESSTKALIKRLEAALENHRTKYGYYPSSGGDYEIIRIANNTSTYTPTGGSSTEIGYVVTFDNSDPAASPGSRAQQLGEEMKEFRRVLEIEGVLKYVKNGQLEDAWGNPVFYAYPGAGNASGFDLVTAGADMQLALPSSNNSKPEYSRPLTDGKRTTYKESDDITNF